MMPPLPLSDLWHSLTPYVVYLFHGKMYSLTYSTSPTYVELHRCCIYVVDSIFKWIDAESQCQKVNLLVINNHTHSYSLENSKDKFPEKNSSLNKFDQSK